MYLCEPIYFGEIFYGKHHFGNFKVISHWHLNIPLFNSFGKHFIFLILSFNNIFTFNGTHSFKSIITCLQNTQTNKVFILSKWKFIYWDCQILCEQI